MKKRNEYVVLVDVNDKPLGMAEKMAAHQKGLLHRAFSILLFNDAGEILLQRRAQGKYHCGGLWTNTCCSHQRPGETDMAAARRRLMEEMGIQTPLHHAFSFVYKAQFPNGLTEHEYDHVFTGTWNGTAAPDPAEVMEWKFTPIEKVDAEMKADPGAFTPWFRILFERMMRENRIPA